jgi:uncharacterized repeat protein (TIGR01451 family)
VCGGEGEIQAAQKLSYAHEGIFERFLLESLANFGQRSAKLFTTSMRRFLMPVCLAWVLAVAPCNASSHVTPSPDFGRIPLHFEPNEGQAGPSVQYLSEGDGFALYLGAEGASLSLRADPGRSAKVTMSLVGSRSAVSPTAEKPQAARINYFIGNDPGLWHSNIPTFAAVKYSSIYPGVDLVYYGRGRKLEYDFIVAPGADPGVIGLNLGGAVALHLRGDGGLAIVLEGGELEWRPPVAYQESGGSRQGVECRYRLSGNTVRFELGNYDRRKPLVIDPVLLYSTYLGGSSSSGDNARSVVVDSAGNACFTGYVNSFEFPHTSGPTAKSTASYAYVTKLDTTGTNLIFSTFIGGSGSDTGRAIALDGDGNIYIAGQTSSYNFPNTNAFQPAHAVDTGSHEDAFFTELSASGSNIVYSTYIGGNDGNYESAYAVGVDSNGIVYVAGTTDSTTFPITPGALRTNRPTFGGVYTGFITSINPAKAGTNSLNYSSYVGGTNIDGVTGITVNGAGNAYVTGFTSSGDFATTSNAFQTKLSGYSDAFVCELNPAGTGLVFSTFLGGSGNENYGNTYSGIALDPDGNVYVTGTTGSVDFPTTAGAAQQTFGGGNIEAVPSGDAFITKFNPTGTALIYSTYFGGSLDEIAYALALDTNRSVYITGQTTSLDMPTRQPLYPFNRFDAFATTNAAGNWRGLSVGAQNVNTIAVDPSNGSNIYAGTYRSGNNPVLYKSIDGGLTWQADQTGMPTNIGEVSVTCLAIDPSHTSTIYAGFDTYGIYKSVNGGASWVVASNGLCNGLNVYCLAVDPHNSTNVFAGATCGFYRSTNGGALWMPASISGQVYAIVPDPVTAGVVYAGANSGVYKSFDDGDTFGAASTFSSGVYSMAINPTAPTNLFVGTFESGIYETVNGGTNWFVTGQSYGEIQHLVIDPSSPSNLYASEIVGGGSFGVIQSTNAGTNWYSADSGIPGYAGYQYIYGLAVDPSHAGVVYAASTFATGNAFVAKLDPSGSFFVYADYLGGTKGGYDQPNSEDSGQGIAVDSTGNIVVVGQTTSSDFPLTNFYSGYFNNNQTAFIAKIGSASNADMAVAITTSSNEVPVNGSFIYKLTVANNGPDNATTVTLVDALPSADTLQSAALSQGTYQLDGQTLTCNLGSIANGASATVTLTILPTLTGAIQNTATVTANENDNVLSNNIVSAVETVQVNSALHTDLALTVVPAPNPALLGYPVTYSFNVTNNGPDAASGVLLTNLLPADVTAIFLSSSQGTPVQVGQSVSCLFGNLAAGAGATMEAVLTPSARGTLTDIAAVSGNESDPNPANNVVTDQLQVVAANSQVIQNGPVTLQSNLNFTLTVTNTGPDPIYNLSVLDYLPSDVTFQSANSTEGTCSYTSGVITCSVGILAVDSVATISIAVTGPATLGIFTNVIQAYSGSVELLVRTNVTTANIIVSTIDVTNKVVAGQLETSITTVSNAGPDTAVNLIVDRLLGGYPYYSSASMSVPGTITNYPSAGYTYVQFTISNLAPGGVATLTASVIPYLAVYPTYYPNYTQTFESMINNGNDWDYQVADPVFVTSGPGLLSFSQPSFVSAPDSASAPVAVIRDGGSVGTVSVSYFTTDGTAVGGIDYQPVSGVLTFQPGQIQANIYVPLLTNVTYSENKTLNLFLSNPQSGATFGQPTAATLTIAKNHVPSLASVMLLSRAWTNFPVLPGNYNAHLDAPSMAPDGRWIAFASMANDLAIQITNQSIFTNVFVTDMSSGEVTLASVDMLGVGCGDSNSWDAQITPDGRYVAFQSYSTDLVSNDFNNNLDVFVRDLELGQTKLVSIRADGTSSSIGSAVLDSISTNGQYVLFETAATDIVAQAVSGSGDVYVRDLVNNKTTLASQGANGPGNEPSQRAAMTPDGRYVVFSSYSTNLVAAGVVTNFAQNIYVRDTVADTTRIVSVNAGQGGNEESSDPLITPDGQHVVFNGYATNLAPNVTNKQENVFISDLTGGAISLVDVSGAGLLANSYGEAAAVSTNGQFVLFYSAANNLVSNSVASQSIFLRDVVSNNTYLVSVNLMGSADNTSGAAAMTPDGRFVAFTSSDDLATNYDYPPPGVYVRDMLSNTTALVNISTNASGNSGNQLAASPSITPDGRYVSYVSAANNLISGPIYYSRNVFRRDRVTAETAIVSAVYSQTGINFQTGNNQSGTSSAPSISTNGQWAAFDSYASDLAPEDTNSLEHVYLVNLTNGGALTLISATFSGIVGNAASTHPVLSADGSTVIFQSYANNLVSSVNNGVQNIYAYNVATGAISLVTVNTNGVGGNSSSGVGDTGGGYSVSANGRYVAFLSEATDLVTNVFTNSYNEHLFMRDLQAGVTELIDTNISGRIGDNTAGYPVISPDGATVSFASAADLIVPGVTNLTGGFQDYQLYQRNLATGTIVLISATPSGGETTNIGTFDEGLYYAQPVVSSNAQFVAWAGICPDLVPNCTSSNGQIFVRNMLTGVTTCVSVNSNGVSGPTASAEFFGVAPSMTPDGRYIAFASTDSDLAPNATNGMANIFVRDTIAQKTTLVSVNAAGTSGVNGNCTTPMISADGHYVTFESQATDLVPGGVPAGVNNLYRRDLVRGATILLSPALGNLTAGDNGIGYGVGGTSTFAVSSDGTVSVFSSTSDNLVASDFNTASDVFAMVLSQDSATADLGLALTAPASVPVGAKVTNSITITNGGPTVASAVVIAFPVPASSQYGSAHASVGSVTLSNGVVFCDITSLSPNAAASFTVILSAPEAGQLYAVASVSASQPDLNPYNNTAAVLIQVGKVVNNSPLLAARISGTVQRQIDFSWPDTTTGFTLQTATTLIPPIEWKSVTNTITDDGVNFNLTLTTFPGTSQFFRLKQ